MSAYLAALFPNPPLANAPLFLSLRGEDGAGGVGNEGGHHDGQHD